MVRSLALVVALLAAPLSAQTYYVDPDATCGGGCDGSAALPWTDPEDMWPTVDTQLASSAVTVYFSAREAGSDVNQASTDDVDLERDDTTSNVLTLDGKSQYNTNDGTPSWSAYSGTSRYQMTVTYPFSSVNFSSPWTRRYNITIQGFVLIATAGKCMDVGNLENMIVDDIDCSHQAGGSVGPSIHLDNYLSTNSGTVWTDGFTLKNSIIRDSYGECVYVNGHKTQASEGNAAGTNITIQDNIISDCGLRGGEGDGIDLKDGITNCLIEGNEIDSVSDNGIVADSGCDIVGNYIYDGGDEGVSLSTIEATLTNRTNAEVVNNIIHSNAAGGIHVRGPGTDQDNWLGLKVWFNTIIDNGGNGIDIDPNNQTEPTVEMKGNILFDNSTTVQLDVEDAAELTAHVDNLYWVTGGSGTLVSIAAVNYTSADLVSSFEATALVELPDLVDAAGSAATDYKLTSLSPCIDHSDAVAGYTDDYFGVTRGAAWDCGAAEFGGGAVFGNAVLLNVVTGLLWVGRMWL